MRVAYVCTDPGVPVFGSKGASIHARSVLRVLRERGAGVDLITTRPGGQAPADLAEVRVHDLGRPAGATPAEREEACRRADAAVAGLLDELHREAPLELVYERYSLWGRAATRWASEHEVPSVLEVNAPLVEEQATHRVLVDREGADRVAREAFSRAAAVHGISDRVEMTGAVDPSEVPRLLHRMHVAVAPYPPLEEFYFSPLKVYEYLAAGLPVVATSVGELPRALENGRLGVLVPPGEPDALARALTGLREDPGTRDRLGRAGRRAAVHRHDWSRVVARTLELSGAGRG